MNPFPNRVQHHAFDSSFTLFYSLSFSYSQSVWPDARIKKIPFFTKVAQKEPKQFFIVNEWFLKWHKKLPKFELIL